MSDWSSCGVNSATDVPTLKCLEIVFQNILNFSSGLVLFILFVMFVIGSFNYLISGGDAEKVKKAQGTIKFALIGVIIFVCSFLILKIISYLFLGGSDILFKFEIPS